MKNLITYYVLILAPLGCLILLSKIDLINSLEFASCLLFYATVYRTYIDGKRLAVKNIIDSKDIWKLIIPGRRLRHVTELYFK